MKKLFVAIEIPKELKEKINIELIEPLGEVKKVSKENLHITLAYIGEVFEQNEKVIIEKLKKIQFSKFPILLGGTGSFDEKVIWLSAQAIELFTLAENISKELRIDNEFAGHIIIAKAKEGKDITENFKKIRGKRINQTIKVNKFVLLENKPSIEGSTYCKITEFKANLNLKNIKKQ